MPLRRPAVAAFFLALSAPLPAPAQPHSPAPNTLTDAEKKAGWILLFDGHSLDGWRGYKKPDATDSRWKAEDGSLALPPDNGKDTHGQRDIITKDTFEQFELVVDWKIAPGGNSGIKYFVLEDRDSAIGHEYQVIDDERHPDAKVGPHRQTAAFYDVLQANDRPTQTRRRMEHDAHHRARADGRALAEREEGAAVRAQQPGAERGHREEQVQGDGAASASARTPTSCSRITATRSGSATSRFGASA